METYEEYAGIVDYAAGVHRFGGNEALFRRCLFGFLQDESYAALLQAVETEHFPAAFTAAHTLKGVTGNLSMTALYDQLLPLVEALRSQNYAPVPALFEPVRKSYEQAVALLERKKG